MGKLKKKIKSFFVLFVLGIVFIIIGLIKGGHNTFMSIGFAYIVVAIVNCIKLKRIYADEDRARQYETANQEERVIFIADKSRSLTFAITLVTEFLGGLIALFLGYEDISTLFFALAALQVCIYFLCHFYFSKKY